MTREKAIKQLNDLQCHCSDMNRGENVCTEWAKDIIAIEMAINSLENEEKLLKENKALKNRCKVSTQGLLCAFCPLECEQRSAEFREVSK